MSNGAAEIFPLLNRLGLSERAKLAEHLLRTLDEPEPDELERLWVEEARRRLTDFRAGKTEAVSTDEVFRRAIADIS